MSKNQIKILLKNNEKGYTLAIVLMVMLVFSVLGMSAMAMTTNSVKLSGGEREDQAVFYIAESGVTYVMSEVENIVGSLSKNPSIQNENEFFTKLEREILPVKTINSFERNLGESPSANVSIKLVEVMQNTKERKYEITSLGKIGNHTRTVGGSFIVSYSADSNISLPAAMGIFSDSKVLITNGTVEGNVILNKYKTNGIEISGNPLIKGKVFVPQNSASDVFSAPQWWIDQNKPEILKIHESTIFPLPPFPDQFPNNFAKMSNKIFNNHLVISGNNINITHSAVADYKINLDKNYEFNDINFNSNRKLTFIVNEDRSIVVNNISGNGHLQIEGSGKLTIYIKENIQIDGHLNSQKKDNLLIYLGPSKIPSNPKTLRSSDYAEFNASVYAKDANIEVVGSAGINGHILTGGTSVRLNGATSAAAKGTVVFAPNADVEVVGSGILKGGIISKTFTMRGGAKVLGDTVDLESIPFFGNSNNNSESSINKGMIKEIDK
ncbi:pilus assembly PilX N-terminal domain-containing protein [Planococcus sp. N064]|uniref:Pilus assembly PilX N-terminal domain-containing protein n=1 Tax=Planococcus liqunii TaxID=3058394 RepID=A0ABT8MQ87_9BACL|nr:pilus assembly PilX N-terminal domain-containing protein [Planococcus sp. N064]MDN7227019.1 pilus assembly PilX N-terminal domain-containing protein [Planococcus sp. N064]